MMQDTYIEEWYGDADPANCLPPDYYLEKLELFKSQPRLEGCAVLLGDSLTDFGRWNLYLNGVRLLNRGIAGDKIEGMTLRLDEVARHNPSKIFLLAGTNNLVKHSSATADSVLPLMKDLISNIRAKMPQAGLYVQSVLPQNPVSLDWSDHFNSDVESINKSLRDMATEYGYTYVDIASPLKDAEGNLRSDYTVDGCHLTDEAYLVWASTIRPHIN